MKYSHKVGHAKKQNETNTVASNVGEQNPLVRILYFSNKALQVSYL